MLEKLHCLHFCANAPKMSIFLGKPIKGATNMTSALQHCKTNFFCKFSWPYCIQSKYADVFKKCIFVLDWSTRDVVFVLFKLFLWPFLPKKDQSLACKAFIAHCDKKMKNVQLNFRTFCTRIKSWKGEKFLFVLTPSTF